MRIEPIDSEVKPTEAKVGKAVNPEATLDDSAKPIAAALPLEDLAHFLEQVEGYEHSPLND